MKEAKFDSIAALQFKKKLRAFLNVLIFMVNRETKCLHVGYFTRISVIYMYIYAHYIDRRVYAKCLYLSEGKSESIGKPGTEFPRGYSTDSLVPQILANECRGTFSVSSIPWVRVSTPV